MTGKPWRPSMPKEEQEQLDEHAASFADRFPGLPDLGPRYFDRAGNPMTFGEWAEAMNDDEYRRVAETMVGDMWISTVWLGLDHGFGAITARAYGGERGPPVIFETMVFDQGEEARKRWEEEMRKRTKWRYDFGAGEAQDFQERYATEAQALKGHKEAVVAVEANLIRREPDEADDG